MMFRICLSVVTLWFVISPLMGINPADTIKSPGKVNNIPEQYNSFIVGFDYSNNATTDSRLNDLVSQPSYYPYLSLYNKTGIFFTGGVNIINNSDSSLTKNTSNIIFSAGYEFKPAEKVTIIPSFSHLFYDSRTMLLNRLYSNYIDIAASYQLKKWNSTVSGSYQWGEINDWIMNAKTGLDFSITKLFTKTDLLMFQPNISVQLSNPNYYSKLFSFLNEYIETRPNAGMGRLVYDIYNIRDRSPELISLRQKLLEDRGLAYMIRDYLPTGIPVSDILTSKNNFTITSATASLPISYLVGDFTLSFTVSVYRTINQPIYLENRWYTYVSGGVSYGISW